MEAFSEKPYFLTEKPQFSKAEPRETDALPLENHSYVFLWVTCFLGKLSFFRKLNFSKGIHS